MPQEPRPVKRLIAAASAVTHAAGQRRVGRHTYPIDPRDDLRALLGFDAVSGKSLAGRPVSVVISRSNSCARPLPMAMMHLSALLRELVLWTSAQFNLIDLPDPLCTGSSIMPQKKNPDVPELVRRQDRPVYGAFDGTLS